MYVLPFGQMSLWGNETLFMLGTALSVSKPDKIFMSKFIGLVDGDGYIEIGPQKQYNKSTTLSVKSTIRARLVIRLQNRDSALLTYFSTVLGVGSISSLVSENQTRLIFSKKDLSTVIVPLMKSYDLHFLTFNRIKQFALLNYILDNNIVYWDSVKFIPTVLNLSEEDILNLHFFTDWLIGFTVAEGSFGIKKNGSAFYSIKQKGTENYNIIKAICKLITEKEARPIKADSANCFQLTLSSKLDVQKVIDFFSSPDNSLFGYKLLQYNLWLDALKTSKRYKEIKFHG